MNSKKVHVYFVPGLAAGKEIFKNIVLPEEQFNVHILEWLIPEKNELIADYAKRMAARVTEPDSVLVGVSFGGVMVQEMNAYLKLRRLVIISSIKTKHELPTRLKATRNTKLYKLIPTGFLLSAEDLTRYAVGPRSKKRLTIYNEYLHVRDRRYLDWAIANMLNWKRIKPLPNVIHIHGDADVVLPTKNIKDFIPVKGGTHIMIINKGRWISNKLIELIR